MSDFRLGIGLQDLGIPSGLQDPEAREDSQELQLGPAFLVIVESQVMRFLDDRVGLVLKADDKIHMDRCRRIDLGWGPDTPPEWTINIGDERIWQDPAQRALGRIERLIAGLHDLGVW